MAKSNQATKSPANAAPAAAAAAKKEDAKDLKVFEGITDQDAESIRRGIEEIRALANSATAQCILLAGTRTSFHYSQKDSKGKVIEQDGRVKERARERGGEAVLNLRMYFRKMGEELRGLEKTIG